VTPYIALHLRLHHSKDVLRDYRIWIGHDQAGQLKRFRIKILKMGKFGCRIPSRTCRRWDQAPERKSQSCR
jgi:hypothetical protein